MNSKWELKWSQKFVSGNIEIDRYHKKIIDGVVELYEMLEDSSRFKDKIPLKTYEIEEALFDHMDIEIGYMKKYNLPEWVEHDEDHNKYRKEFDFYKDYKTPPLIRAVLTGELSRNYMQAHFFMFDVDAISKINQKLMEEESLD